MRQQIWFIILLICFDISLAYPQHKVDDFLKLVKDIGSENKEVRERAASLLQDINEEAVPELLKEINKRDKIEIIEALGLIKLEKYFVPAIEALIETLKDPIVREVSLRVLYNKGIVIVPKEAEWMYIDNISLSERDNAIVKEIKRKIETFTISLEFCKIPFKEVISYIQNKSELPIDFSPEIISFLENRSFPLFITVRIKEWKLKNILKVLLHYNDMVYIFKNNKMLIKFCEFGEFKRAQIAIIKKTEDIILRQKLQTSSVSFNLENITFNQAVYKLGELADLNVLFIPSINDLADDFPDVCLRCSELQLESALKLLTVYKNHSYFIENNLILIR